MVVTGGSGPAFVLVLVREAVAETPPIRAWVCLLCFLSHFIGSSGSRAGSVLQPLDSRLELTDNKSDSLVHE